MMTTLRTRSLLLACLSLSAITLASCGPGGGDGDAGPSGTCPPGLVDSTSSSTFFASIACTYERYAVDTALAGDTTFIHGQRYAVVIAADGTVTFPADGGDLVFANGQFEDFDHETNVLAQANGYSLIIQWDKAAEELDLIVGMGQAAGWRFDEEEPPPPPGPLDANDEHGDLSFAVGTHSGEIYFIGNDDTAQPTALALCDVVTISVNEEAGVTAAIGDDVYTIAYSDDAAFFTEQFGTISLRWISDGADGPLEIGVSFEQVDAGTPPLFGLGVRRAEGTYEFESMTLPRMVTYSARPDEETCP